MVSPELLRRYPFFGHLDDAHLKSIAMLTEEIACGKDETLFEENQPANALYFLIEGSVDLRYVVTNRDDPRQRKEFFVSEVNPGEPFGISALIEPYCYVATVRSNRQSRVLKIDGAALRALCEVESTIGHTLTRQIAKAAMARLHETRIQLIAARV